MLVRRLKIELVISNMIIIIVLEGNILNNFKFLQLHLK